MMTSKERAALRAQANPLEVTLIVGKSGISQTLLDEAVILLDSHELVKGRVLETAGLTAREASDMLCEALGAEGIVCVGTKFVIWRKSEKLAQEKKKAAAESPPKRSPPATTTPSRPACAPASRRPSSSASSASSTSTTRRSPPRSSAAASRRKNRINNVQGRSWI